MHFERTLFLERKKISTHPPWFTHRKHTRQHPHGRLFHLLHPSPRGLPQDAPHSDSRCAGVTRRLPEGHPCQGLHWPQALEVTGCVCVCVFCVSFFCSPHNFTHNLSFKKYCQLYCLISFSSLFLTWLIYHNFLASFNFCSSLIFLSPCIISQPSYPKY